MSIESSHDCGHPCCSERQNPLRHHVVPSSLCLECKGQADRFAAIEAAAAELRKRIDEDDAQTALTDTCSQCGATKRDQVGLSLLETDDLEADEWGFCSVPCMVLFVRERWVEVAS